jgi:hypothetical protein
MIPINIPEKTEKHVDTTPVLSQCRELIEMVSYH